MYEVLYIITRLIIIATSCVSRFNVVYEFMFGFVCVGSVCLPNADQISLPDFDYPIDCPYTEDLLTS